LPSFDGTVKQVLSVNRWDVRLYYSLTGSHVRVLIGANIGDL